MTDSAKPARMRRRIAAGAAVAWMGVIFALSAIPGRGLPPGRYSSLAHFAFYAVLGAFYFAALDPSVDSVRAGLWAVGLASAYGITDEFHQSFVPGRMTDPVDWLVDTAGAIAAVVLLMWLTRRRSADRNGARDT